MFTESDEGYNFLSPATLLNHEFGHAYDQLTNTQYDPSEKDEQYDYAVERNAITGIETKTAEALGELTKGEVTRMGYNGYKSDVPSPISNDLLLTPEILSKIQLWNQE